MANTYLTKTSSSTGNNTKSTFSAWVKRSDISSNYPRLVSILPSANNGLEIFFRNTDTLEIKVKFNSATRANLQTTRLFRDVNAWYHILVSIDSTSGTADDRVRLYINGVKETSFGTRINPDQDANMKINASGETFQIGAEVGGSSNNFSGLLSHVHWIDGTAYDATAFGSTDATTGEWEAKTSPSVTYGTNGFFILKDGNGITDQSGEGNDFTLGGGTLTDLKDNPDNVFCTMNPLDNQIASSTFSNGNNTIVTNNSNYTWNTGTLGASSGKYYWEIKYSATSGTNYNLIGIADRPTTSSAAYLGSVTNTSNYGYYSDSGNVYAKNGTSTAFGDSYSAGDIIGVSLDLDNNKLYFSKNGTWQNSGVPTSGATGTGAVSIDAISSTTTGVYFTASGDYGSTQYVTNQHNFGNGYFGTTAITTNSGNGYAGAEGSSKFNYTVPTGYSALSTKGLNE